MTIGIAASGPNAGRAILAGLKAAEAIGRGALHGFVSLVAIGRDGELHRAETQNGGTRGLIESGPLPITLLEAERAGLMSSGPNRPEPLSQFTPADPWVGLLTGHRFPPVPGPDGRPLNIQILDLMRQGSSPEIAIENVVAAHEWADAGFIALSREGRLHAANTPYLVSFPDAGQARGALPDGSAEAVVLHNSIEPHGALASLVLEVVLDAMTLPPSPVTSIAFGAGVPLEAGSENVLVIDQANRVSAVVLRDVRYLAGRWNIGLGYRAAVMSAGRKVGRALYEPFLRIEDGRVASIDGLSRLMLAIVLT